jgi:GTPase SAR1 family protein
VEEHDFRDKFYFYKFLEPKQKVEINERFKIVLLGPSGGGKSSLFSLLPQKIIKKSLTRKVVSQSEIIQRAGWKSTVQKAIVTAQSAISDAIGRRQSSAPLPMIIDDVEENILFTLWDFAKDPELDTDPSLPACAQTLHRLFLTSQRTLYLICVDMTKFNATEVDYYVQTLHTYAPKAPVIIVGTHQDEVSGQRISQIESFVKTRYRKYKSLKDFSTVSCTSLKNISKLKNLIVRRLDIVLTPSGVCLSS